MDLYEEALRVAAAGIAGEMAKALVQASDEGLEGVKEEAALERCEVARLV